MRVLVASVPAAGHFHPLVPLALALRDAGDEVMVASATSVCERARSIGLAAAPVGTEVGQWFETLRSRVRGIPGDGLPPGGSSATSTRGCSASAARRPWPTG